MYVYMSDFWIYFEFSQYNILFLSFLHIRNPSFSCISLVARTKPRR